MDTVIRVRETPSWPKSFGMCTSTRPSSKSRSFYRYKTAPHVFIPLALETACSQPFAQNHNLTPAVCADPQSRGWGPPVRNASCASRTLRGLGRKTGPSDRSSPPAIGARGGRRSRPFGTRTIPTIPMRGTLSYRFPFHIDAKHTT